MLALLTMQHEIKEEVNDGMYIVAIFAKGQQQPPPLCSETNNKKGRLLSLPTHETTYATDVLQRTQYGTIPLQDPTQTRHVHPVMGFPGLADVKKEYQKGLSHVIFQRQF